MGKLLLLCTVFVLSTASPLPGQQGGSKDPVLAYHPPEGRPCDMHTYRAVPLDEVLQAAFRMPDRLPEGIPDTLILYVRYDSTGEFATLSLTSGRDPGRSLLASGSEAYDQLRRQFVDRASVNAQVLLLLMPGGDSPPTPVTHGYECRPILSNQALIVSALRSLIEMRGHLLGNRQRTAEVRVFVSTAGVVTDALIHTSTGVPELDAALIRIAELGVFLPAWHGGQFLPVWVSLPLTLAPN